MKIKEHQCCLIKFSYNVSKSKLYTEFRGSYITLGNIASNVHKHITLLPLLGGITSVLPYQ
jgi:hypothetical protein